MRGYVAITSIALGTQCSLVAVGHEDGKITLLAALAPRKDSEEGAGRLSSEEEEEGSRTLLGHEKAVTALAWSPAQHFLLASASADHTIQVLLLLTFMRDIDFFISISCMITYHFHRCLGVGCTAR